MQVRSAKGGKGFQPVNCGCDAEGHARSSALNADVLEHFGCQSFWRHNEFVSMWAETAVTKTSILLLLLLLSTQDLPRG